MGRDRTSQSGQAWSWLVQRVTRREVGEVLLVRDAVGGGSGCALPKGIWLWWVDWTVSGKLNSSHVCQAECQRSVCICLEKRALFFVVVCLLF